MAKYLMLGKYSAEAVKGISSGRSKKAAEIIKKNGGKINFINVLVGSYDIAILVDFPGNKELIKTSIALTKLTGVGFTGLPAISVEELKNMKMEDLPCLKDQ